MAKQVKVFNDEISSINKEIDNLITQLNETYSKILKNGTLISEKWKGAAAVSAVNGIKKSAADLKKATEEIKTTKEHVIKTSKAITDADSGIKKKFQSIIIG